MKIYEGEHHRRGFLEPGVDDSGVRALRLRKALPRLEMPCVRAAMSSSIGVRLLGAPQPVRRKILALAFDLPDEEERLAEKRRDEKFLECLERWVKAGDVPPRPLVETPPAGSDPPMIAGALDAAVAEALGAAPGLTGVAKEMGSLAESPEPSGRDPPADPGQAPPGFHEEMAARMGIPRPAAAADPEEDA